MRSNIVTDLLIGAAFVESAIAAYVIAKVFFNLAL